MSEPVDSAEAPLARGAVGPSSQSSSSQSSSSLLEVSDLRTWFPVRKGPLRRVVDHVKAVDDVSFQVERGRTLALVGESGSGKTTVGRSILRLVQPSAGSVRFDGVELLGLDERELRPFRKRIQMVFQDPTTSLNPRMRVLDLVAEGLDAFGLTKSRAERMDRVVEALEAVKLGSEHLRRFPHEFSGGQRQRLGIARALSVGPDLIVCDEAVSALDVSIQAQILNLLASLQERLGVAYLFITHDLSVVRHLAHRVAVMHQGKLVETAETEQLFRQPEHPYTARLLSAVLSIEPAPLAPHP
ncbi:MAG TPA: ATP-binding cassette domain-containing protein [Polyangiaceae bacterium]|nr:ATP-binding cassette domain-containing protein [Polyangiaceae bacterium]